MQSKSKQSKLKNSKGTFLRLLSYMTRDYLPQLIFVVIGIIIGALSSVAGSMFVQILIDDYIEPLLLQPNPVFTGLLKAILIMGLIYLIGIVVTYLYNLVMVVISQKVQRDIRDDMFAGMQRLPIRYFDTNLHGDIMSRYTNDIDTLRQMISQSIPALFSSALTIVCVFLAMLVTSPLLTGLVAVMLLLMQLVVRGITGKSRGFFMEQQRSLGTVNGYIEEMMEGQKVVKVFCHEDTVKEDFSKINDELCNNATQANRYANILMPVVGSLGYVLYVLIAIAGGALVIGGITGLTLGGVAAFLQLSRALNGPIAQISQQVNSVLMGLVGAERVFELMDEEPETDEGYVSLAYAKNDNGGIVESDENVGIWAWKHPHSDGTTTYTRLTGDVVFEDVDFGYVDKKLVLKNISLHADQGQKMALVGSTGAGKTTITNLLNRFYDIQEGKIRYDGINIEKIKKPDLRRALAIVLQDTHLFTGSVMENIRYGKLSASDEEVRAAAKLANADSFIARLPHGYDTVLTDDGEGLSQGQRQLLSIARAAVADPPVMILDEATSSIDTRTEALVQSGMDALMYGRTVFVIAHRLSTVKNSNVIMVLEQGEIIERGSHNALIAAHGRYYQLYTGAFELE